MPSGCRVVLGEDVVVTDVARVAVGMLTANGDIDPVYPPRVRRRVVMRQYATRGWE
jgi:hypothetical protein